MVISSEPYFIETLSSEYMLGSEYYPIDDPLAQHEYNYLGGAYQSDLVCGRGTHADHGKCVPDLVFKGSLRRFFVAEVVDNVDSLIDFCDVHKDKYSSLKTCVRDHYGQIFNKYNNNDVLKCTQNLLDKTSKESIDDFLTFLESKNGTSEQMDAAMDCFVRKDCKNLVKEGEKCHKIDFKV